MKCITSINFKSYTMEFSITSTLIALLSFLLFLFIFLKSQSISKSSKSYSHIPGPKPLPLIGNLHLMLRAVIPHRLFRDLAAAHGPLMHLQLGEIHALVVSSAALAKQVMNTHDTNFANRPLLLTAEIISYNFTGIVFTPYGDYWRKICTLELLSARRVQSFRHIRVEENMNLCKWIASREGTLADLSEKLYLSAYGVITTAVAGAKNKEGGAITSIIEEVAKLSSGFIMADLYPSIKLLPLITGSSFKLRRMQRRLDRLLVDIIEQHKAGNNGASGGVEDLVDVLLKIQQDESQHSLTTENIKAVMMDMFVAGTETSATVVEWAMSEMLRKPSTLNKAHEQVRKVFDDKGFVDEAKFDELTYLKLIIKETLRLHPPAPLLLPRVNTQGCNIHGYEIPAKTQVIVNAWALGRDPEYWKDPEEFIPERFEESSVDFKGNNLEFIPFGSGRRVCPGMLFGLANVELPLAMLLYHFDWKLPNGMKNEELDMTEAYGASVSREHKLHLIPIVKRPLPAGA